MKKKTGFGFLTIVFFILLTLKLGGWGMVANWSWIWVTLPLWITPALWICAGIGVFFGSFFYFWGMKYVAPEKFAIWKADMEKKAADKKAAEAEAAETKKNPPVSSWAKKLAEMQKEAEKRSKEINLN